MNDHLSRQSHYTRNQTGHRAWSPSAADPWPFTNHREDTVFEFLAELFWIGPDYVVVVVGVEVSVRTVPASEKHWDIEPVSKPSFVVDASPYRPIAMTKVRYHEPRASNFSYYLIIYLVNILCPVYTEGFISSLPNCRLNPLFRSVIYFVVEPHSDKRLVAPHDSFPQSYPIVALDGNHHLARDEMISHLCQRPAWLRLQQSSLQ